MSNEQVSSIGSDDGLAPVRRQAIIWTNDGLVYWRVYASLGLNELKTTEVYSDKIIVTNHKIASGYSMI